MGIDEQFYFLFPLLAWWCGFARGIPSGRRRLAGVLVPLMGSLALASIGLESMDDWHSSSDGSSPVAAGVQPGLVDLPFRLRAIASRNGTSSIQILPVNTIASFLLPRRINFPTLFAWHDGVKRFLWDRIDVTTCPEAFCRAIHYKDETHYRTYYANDLFAKFLRQYPSFPPAARRSAFPAVRFAKAP